MVIPIDKPIVLLGFMGSGKSTLGKQLAASLGWTFTDLDCFIEAEENRTIPEIFEQDGEATFRMLESNALKKVLNQSHQVIAIGGGAPCHPGNLQLIREKSLSIYLKISETQLLHRLAWSSTPRPLLNGKSESEIQSFITDLLVTREPYYLKADIIIESDAITTGIILSKLEKETL
ncbi:MAG: shikimate kinase [Porphyromonadaceae bacterium]|nr:MAG: shikimate kinase [Porphyromonadaceae bacterium]